MNKQALAGRLSALLPKNSKSSRLIAFYLLTCQHVSFEQAQFPEQHCTTELWCATCQKLATLSCLLELEMAALLRLRKCGITAGSGSHIWP